MARQARRGTRHHGRSSRDGSWRVRAAAFADGSGSPTATRSASSADTEPLETSRTYRSLLLKGLAPDEAANLTAFLCGIPVRTQHWKLGEINRLLFLRRLRVGGRFTGDDGIDPAPAAG